MTNATAPRHGSHFFGDDLLDGPITLIDGFVRVGESAGIGIGDMNITKGLASDFVWRVARRPDRIVKRIVFVSVAVGPAIDGD